MYRKLTALFDTMDAVLLTAPYHLRYFTGFTGGEGYAVLCRDARYLIVDSRYTEMAMQEAAAYTVIEYGAGRLYAALQEVCDKNGVRTVGFEDAVLSCRAYRQLTEALPKLRFTPLGQALSECRMVKTAEELAAMRRAEEIGVLAFRHILPMLKAGTQEVEIAAEIEYFMRKQGASGTSFDTIVVSGVKSSLPHGRAGEKRLERGDFVTMDFGCVYQGYCSDMTRTVVIGKASEKQKEIYETVRRAQEKGLQTLRAGITGKEADAAARAVIEQAGYGKFFGHSLGHGVGLEIHELPNLSPSSEIVLKEGMVVTCEPGIYIPDFGGVRIEDMVCIRKDGIENLTNLSKDLLELE